MFSGRGSFAISRKRATSFSRTKCDMNLRMGTAAAGDRVDGSDLTLLQGNDRVAINGLAHRLHEEEGHDHRQANEGLVRWSGLQAQGLAEEMKDNQQACEWRHADEHGRDEGQEGQQDDDGPLRSNLRPSL